MNEDTGPVKVNGGESNPDHLVGKEPTTSRDQGMPAQPEADLTYSQKADQLMINLLSEIRDDVSSMRGWVVFIGILFLLGLIMGFILGACGMLV